MHPGMDAGARLLDHVSGRDLCPDEWEGPMGGAHRGMDGGGTMDGGARGRDTGKKGGWGWYGVLCLFLWNRAGNVWLLIAMTTGRVGRELLMATFMANTMGNFYLTMTQRDLAAFTLNAEKYFVLIVISATLDSACDYASEMLYVRWRYILTSRLNAGYMANQAYYRLTIEKKEDKGGAHPDQRIASDARLLCEILAKVCNKLVAAPATIFIYTVTTYLSIGIIAPVGVWTFFLVGTALNFALASRTVAVMRRRLQGIEGEFRTALVGLGERAEQVALVGGEEREEQGLGRHLQNLRAQQGRLAFAHFGVKVVGDLWGYCGAMGNYLLIGVAIFAPGWWSKDLPDAADPSVIASDISRASFHCIMLIQGFTLIIEAATDIGDLRGYLLRISSFLDSLDAQIQHPPPAGGDRAGGQVQGGGGGGGGGIWARMITVCNPEGDALIKDLSFQVSQGESMLVVGPSGVGKTALVRTLGGIWDDYWGDYSTPPAGGGGGGVQMRVLPQRPFCVPGTLADQVLYPCGEDGGGGGGGVYEVLVEVGLGYLVTRYGAEHKEEDWSCLLSPGEVQRLGFARLLYDPPTYAILDEATSSLPEDTEAGLYRLCVAAGITFLSVGHRSSLRGFHRQLLELGEGGSWRLSAL